MSSEKSLRAVLWGLADGLFRIFTILAPTVGPWLVFEWPAAVIINVLALQHLVTALQHLVTQHDLRNLNQEILQVRHRVGLIDPGPRVRDRLGKRLH